MTANQEGGEDSRVVLSQCDAEALQQLEGKFRLIRDYTRSVATGRTTGFYLYGVGGSGKTHNVVAELKERNVPYKLFNSRMTGRGLYNALERFPDAIHVLEDIEPLFRDGGARGVLRAALWGRPRGNDDGPPERPVTWTTHLMEHSFIFTGGVIMTANRPFPNLAELDAVKTRICYMQLVVSDNEMMALMRRVSLDGYRIADEIMDPRECLAVCEFIIEECLGLRRLLDMRLLFNSFADFLQWRECQSGCHWRDMVAARVKERPTRIREARSMTDRDAQKREEQQLAAHIDANATDGEEKNRLWREGTGKSPATFYRRLREWREQDSQ